MHTVDDIENALEIDIPSSGSLRLEDSRRLTGPGLLWDHTGAVLEIHYEGFDPQQIANLWQKYARSVLDAVGWQDQLITERGFEGGHNLAISAPMDQLYSAIFIAETAWHFGAAKLLASETGDFDEMINNLKSVMQREANPDLTHLIEAGQAHGVEILCDDDEVSIGHGQYSQVWPVSNLPDPQDVDWRELRNAPVALITGTNGKTTTTRLCAAIARAAGKVSGLTSTDFVRVGDEVLDKGDYSGPGGARLLLRDKRLEVAFLEVARGGILRRGLATRSARVAIVTNVAADHLGQYGVNTVEELARAKFSVHRALARDGVLVLNADDAYVVTEAAQTDVTIWWFSLDADAPQIRQARAAGVSCAWEQDGKIVFFDGRDTLSIADVSDIPITVSGAARHNVRNVLAATCACYAIGIAPNHIAKGLANFQSDPNDNPGRFNEFDVNGARVFVDFAHNPHSIAAVTETVGGIEARRRFVLLSHAGDRSDDDIREVTKSALELNPDFVFAAELEDYLRGRELGDVTRLIVEACEQNGMPADRVIESGSPSEAVAKVIKALQPGDVALLLVLSERDKVFELLQR
ncbi:Mur ligase family protein [uncultured Roseovarius sp.]|uniref:Mur ligase family protein n=1 Tax=uncultured Roseovarius sp. TaxID=293344 RepID=UPI0026107831|nr:Mur ligase family protein [uncultured Roseovarius sp.]